MKSSSSTEFTVTDGRKFAFPVGIAFLLLAGVFLWRERQTLMWITTSLGGILIVAGLLVPKHLGPVYRAWMRLALLISKVTTPIFMGVVYYVVLTPTGLIMRALGRRPIVHKPRNESLWHVPDAEKRGNLERQF